MATPLAFRATLPSRVVPSKNLMIPVGAVVPDVVGTVAVSVTWPPGATAVADTVNAVVDGAAVAMVRAWLGALAERNTLSPL